MDLRRDDRASTKTTARAFLSAGSVRGSGGALEKALLKGNTFAKCHASPRMQRSSAILRGSACTCRAATSTQARCASRKSSHAMFKAVAANGLAKPRCFPRYSKSLADHPSNLTCPSSGFPCAGVSRHMHSQHSGGRSFTRRKRRYSLGAGMAVKVHACCDSVCDWRVGAKPKMSSHSLLARCCLGTSFSESSSSMRVRWRGRPFRRG
mmetsp:Transcript_4826/g.11635  ORF Transcript_4826/g.11635 Transcript_4826/m.11635 type:complete len:208 (+) Transcript_4826:246-869(+)